MNTVFFSIITCFIFIISILSFLGYRTCTGFVRRMHECFIFFGVIINAILFQISGTTCSLLVYRNVIDFFKVDFISCDIFELTYQFQEAFCRLFIEFSTQTTMIFPNRDSCTSSFPVCMFLFSFFTYCFGSYLQYYVEENGHLCLFPISDNSNFSIVSVFIFYCLSHSFFIPPILDY